MCVCMCVCVHVYCVFEVAGIYVYGTVSSKSPSWVVFQFFLIFRELLSNGPYAS